MPKTIIYPGTFDPIHYGHIDLIKRISTQYDKVIIAVANQTGGKTSCLTFQERIELTQTIIDKLEFKNIIVAGFKGKLTDFARSQNSTVILRGLRNQEDIEMESIISNVTRSPIVSGFFKPSLEVICLMTDPKYEKISSTKIRERVRNHLDISELAPPEVSHKYQLINPEKIPKASADSLGWEYRATNKILTLWSQHQKSVLPAAVGMAIGLPLGGALGCTIL